MENWEKQTNIHTYKLIPSVELGPKTANKSTQLMKL
jgi:hypothetical protein